MTEDVIAEVTGRLRESGRIRAVATPVQDGNEWCWAIENEMRKSLTLRIDNGALRQLPTDLLLWGITTGPGNRFLQVGWDFRMRAQGTDLVVERVGGTASVTLAMTDAEYVATRTAIEQCDNPADLLQYEQYVRDFPNDRQASILLHLIETKRNDWASQL